MNSENPYETPHSEVTDVAEETFGTVKIFSFQGRIGRIRYLGYNMGLIFLALLITGSINAVLFASPTLQTAPTIYLAIIAATWAFFAIISIMLATQRLHDISVSGWLSLLMLVPVVNFIFGLGLCLIPGAERSNRFGPVPPLNTRGVIVLSIIFPLLFVLAILTAIALPAYQQYVQDARTQSLSR